MNDNTGPGITAKDYAEEVMDDLLDVIAAAAHHADGEIRPGRMTAELLGANLVVMRRRDFMNLRDALKVCLEAIDEEHASQGSLPSPAWHWWKAARQASEKANIIGR